MVIKFGWNSVPIKGLMTTGDHSCPIIELSVAIEILGVYDLIFF